MCDLRCSRQESESLDVTVCVVTWNTSQPTGEDSVDRMSTMFSFLEWILSIISPSFEDSEDVQPEPIDPSKCEPCSEYHVPLQVLEMYTVRRTNLRLVM